MVFEVDLEKAYDRVRWDFLEFAMARKGFGLLWRKWIMGCMSSTHLSVLVNGFSSGFFQPSGE